MAARARGHHSDKGDLTPKQRLKAAYFYLCRGIAQQELAALFGVNGGRIAEAVTAARKAFEFNKEEDNGEEA